MKRVLALLVVPLVLAACGSSSGSSGGAPPGEFDGEWHLASGRGPEGEVPVLAKRGISLEIDRGSISGTAACNNYEGRAVIHFDSFTWTTGLFMTEMGCDPGTHESESRYVAALEVVDTIEGDEDTLTLTGPDVELRFGFVPPPPTASLTDTRWELLGLIEGTGADGLLIDVDPAHLLLTSDWKVLGSTGCRDFTGEWAEAGDEIRFTRFAMEGLCKARMESQDKHIIRILGDGFTAEIEEGTLTLYQSRGPDGLMYTAPSS
jgi:heat shock protein HslJ